MPPKKKPKRKPSERRALLSMPKISLAKRRELLTEALYDIVTDANPRHRQALVETVIEAGLHMFGQINGVDPSRFIMFDPSDEMHRLIIKIVQHAEHNELDVDDVCAGIAAQLGSKPIGELLLN